MRNIFNIVKKELDKIFRNPRLIFSTFLLPGVMIFIMYSFMGSTATSQAEKLKTHNYQIVMCNESNVIKSALNGIPNLKVTYITNKEISNQEFIEAINNPESTTYQNIAFSISDEQTDLWINIPTDFDEKVASKEATSIDIIYHSINQYSEYINQVLTSVLQTVELQINPQNPPIINVNKLDTVTEEQTNKSAIAMLVPMLIMTFIFAGALSIACDAIAGEKERGTISTMLMAPINKNEIIFGKILSCIILTIISAVCSFIGLMASFMQNANFFGGSTGVKLEYGVGTYLQVFLILALVSLLAVSIFLLASTIAKTTKEATMYAMPIYIIGILSGSLTMFGSLPTNIGPYLIPIYNLTLALKGILTTGTVTYLPVICITTVIYFILIIFIVNRLFRNERVMFAK